MPFTPLIPPELYLLISLGCFTVGTAASGWLIFFVETSRELLIRERAIGVTIRLIIAAIFLGFGLHFLLLLGSI